MSYLKFYELSKQNKLEVFRSIEYQHGMSAFAIEKDWWVVRTLDILFKSSIKESLVFKGGTSLSKSWSILDRFSEDIDLSIERSIIKGANGESFDGDITNRAVNRLRVATNTFVTQVLFVELKELFESHGLAVTLRIDENNKPETDPAVIYVDYPHEVEHPDYNPASVKIEIGSRSPKDPFAEKGVKSLVDEFFKDEDFSDAPVNVPSVLPERTFLEKLFLLHEYVQMDHVNENPNRLSRHMYDIHTIQTHFSEVAKQALANHELIEKIIAHRQKFYKRNQLDYGKHYPPNFNPLPGKKYRANWEADYRSMKVNMIYNDPNTEFKDLLISLEKIRDQYNKLEL